MLAPLDAGAQMAENPLVMPGSGNPREERLRASSARLVAAADAERRTIEREIHDGIQQDLVALAVEVQLVQKLVRADPDEAARLLVTVEEGLHDALRSVQRLADRVFPSLLEARGLTDALRAAAGAGGISARIENGLAARYPPSLEAAVYFGCREALANVRAHAGAGARAVVRVEADEHTMRFEVADDGIGFDSAAQGFGRGLTLTGDRLEALGGELQVLSEPGLGTRVRGSLPLYELSSAR